MSAAEAETPDVEIAVAAKPENVAVVRHLFAGIGAALGMGDRAIADLRLAVSEACTNVVVHAYDGGEESLIEVAAGVDGSLLHVTVRDHGRGLGPRPDSPGLGLGLPLAKAAARSLDFGRSGDGNEVRMTFLIPHAAVEQR